MEDRPRRRSFRSAAVVAFMLAVAPLTAATADDLEETLRSRWLGAWALTRVEVRSNCDSAYANNDIAGTRVTSRAEFAFAAGELARVDKLNVKGSRVDAYIALAAPLRVAHDDGPFTLYDERTCKVQLLVDVAGKDIRAGRIDAIEAALAQVIARFPARADAEVAPEWNRRIGEPLPADYQETLARHAAWKAEQVNARLAAARADALAEAARVIDRIDDDPGYLAGFAAGVEELRYSSPPACESLASSTFSSSERRAPKEHQGDAGEQRSWRKGFRDGQILTYNLAVARAIERCFVPPPPAAPGQ